MYMASQKLYVFLSCAGRALRSDYPTGAVGKMETAEALRGA